MARPLQPARGTLESVSDTPWVPSQKCKRVVAFRKGYTLPHDLWHHSSSVIKKPRHHSNNKAPLLRASVQENEPWVRRLVWAAATASRWNSNAFKGILLEWVERPNESFRNANERLKVKLRKPSWGANTTTEGYQIAQMEHPRQEK